MFISKTVIFILGEGCVEKPLATLWRNYTQSSRPDVTMQLTVSSGGLKATTKDHGLTEYWAHRLTTCAAPAQFPRLFCWVYRHEGRRLRHELRCHAVLCSTSTVARQIETHLKHSLALALAEFKRDKISRQNARLSLVNSVYENPTMPRRKIMLSTGAHNYKPPLERSKSAPKLTSIEENLEEEEEHFEGRPRLQHSDSAGALLDKRKSLLLRLNETIVPVPETPEETLLDEKSELILAELAQNALKNDLIESCEQSWFSTRNGTPDLIPLDSDEGSLSSGCESASTVSEEKAEFDFKVGGSVTPRVCPDVRSKYCMGVENSETPIKYCPPGLGLENEEVSLVPVGETQSDFSSLRVYKKRACEAKVELFEGEGSEEENGSACSDESGYEEATDSLSSVSNVILV